MTDHPAPGAMPLMRRPTAPALIVLGVAALGLLLLAQDRREARSMAYSVADTQTPPVAAPDAADSPAAAFARADAAGLLIRTGAPVPAGAPAARPATYIAQPGDDLAAIAATLYGDPALAPRIAAANRATLERGLTPGTTLLIPAF